MKTKLQALGVCAAVALTACSSEPMVVTDRAEIAAHRSFGLPTIRGADQCVDDISRDEDIGYGAFADFTLKVDRSGRARLITAQGPMVPLSNVTTEPCRAELAMAISEWRYRPFERGGRTAGAQINERVLMLPAERWRASPRQFPELQNLESVVIRLERWPGLFVCERDRSASYILQIRGTGDVTMMERVHNRVDGGPLLVDGPVHRFTIDRSAVERLIEQFRAANFFSLEAEYASGITDQPGQELTFDTGADRASVLDYVGETVGMPLVVRELQLAVDAAAGLEPLRCGPEMTLRRN